MAANETSAPRVATGVRKRSAPIAGRNFGLVCLTSDDEVRFRTITRTRLRTLPTVEQVTALRSIYRDNLAAVRRALDLCERLGTRLYRLTSSLFPQSEDGAGAELLGEMSDEIAAVGQEAVRRNVRLVMHPDQFVVLSSDSPSVVRNSIAILACHARTMDLLQLPRSPWAAIELHGGKSGRADALVDVIRDLPDEARTRLVLENDEYAYGAAEIRDVCQRAGVPMVFDAHHHVVHEELPSYEHPSVRAMTLAARKTWPDPTWQMVHISNGRESFNDAKHADFITTMPSAFRDVAWIEIEAKMKEQAIRQLYAGL